MGGVGSGAFGSSGYAIVPNVLTGPECDAVWRSLEDANLGRAGARHLMRIPAVSRLANDDRLLEIARDALSSATAIPFRATLFNKTSKANWLIPWHQDTALPMARRLDSPEWGPWSNKNGLWYAHAPEWALKQIVALRVHLDASTADNGPLRVILQTHHSLLTDSEVDLRSAALGASAVECLSPRGGVVAMRPLTIHASSKIVNDLPRRVLHIEFAPSWTFRAGIELGLA
jgi:ectoine hydroxylase-related dioxygenase (phytanoyl-CoA dioxygenase family)